MDYKQLGDLVGVTNPDSSHVISISVTTMDPEMSRNIANSLLNVSVEQINQIVGNGMPSVIDYTFQNGTALDYVRVVLCQR